MKPYIGIGKTDYFPSDGSFPPWKIAKLKPGLVQGCSWSVTKYPDFNIIFCFWKLRGGFFILNVGILHVSFSWIDSFAIWCMKRQDNLTSDSYVVATLRKNNYFFHNDTTTWLKNLSDKNQKHADSKSLTIEFTC